MHGNAGSRHGMARLTEHDVSLILSLYLDGIPQCDLADKFQISRPHVSDIVNRKVWKHVKLHS